MDRPFEDVWAEVGGYCVQTAKRYNRRDGLGLSVDLMKHETMVAVFNACRYYNPLLKVELHKFCGYCTERHFATLLKTYYRDSSRPENIPLETLYRDSDSLRKRVKRDYGVVTPNMTESIAITEAMQEIYQAASPLQWSVITRWIEGKSYSEIGREIGCARKTVDNALAGLRQKLRRNKFERLLSC